MRTRGRGGQKWPFLGVRTLWMAPNVFGIQQDPLKLSKSQKPTNLYSNPKVESNIYQFLLNIQG